MDETISTIGSEAAAHWNQLQTDLSLNTDWSKVLDTYLAQGNQGAGEDQNTSPIDNLPAVVQFLGHPADDASTQAANNFYQFLGAHDLLADAEAHDANLHAHELADSPSNLAEYIGYRNAQDARISGYVGIHRLLLPLHTAADRGLQHLQELAQGIDPLNPKLAPLGVQLRKHIDRLIEQRDGERYGTPKPPGQISVTVEGDRNLLEAEGLDPDEFEQIVKIAAHSYPPSLMAGDMAISLHKSGQYDKTVADMDSGYGTATLNLWPDKLKGVPHYAGRMVSENPRQRLMATLEAVLDHEYGHLAHQNAPITWLRRWDDMVQRGVSFKGLSVYTEHAPHSKNTTTTNEHLAEAIQIYRSDPAHLINTAGLEPLMLLQDLLHTYSDETLAREVTSLQPPLDDQKTHELNRALGVDRQQRLMAALEAASTPA